jgi:hypothetical protein
MSLGSKASLLGLLCAALGWGCADAKGRFDAFEQRRAALAGDAGAPGDSAAGAASGCAPPAPNVVRGVGLLAVETTALPGAAILFLGELETPELGGRTAVKYSYKALNAADRRTQVGEPLVVGPYAIGDDGSFDAPTAESTLPGSANAILAGVAITSQLTLHGTICGVSDFYCGTVTGSVSSPIMGPTTGQFGLALLANEDDIPARPRFGCAEDARALPLE